ncbi:MAG: BlaI/MecI/CopY family transcriptional regulator [Candidatus Andersenbacteria bacterium]|nr:BlaI/MecI/CopY family transcriptional regulator [Candidatus Andersenbacteria bacterium]
MPKKPSTQPTDAELEILRLLWDRGPSTVREVYTELERRRGQLAYTTVLAQLQLLHEKGFVMRDETGRSHIYRPAKPRQQVERGVVKSLIARTFGGMARNLVMHALSIKRASPEELARIDKLFDELEGPHK